MLLIVLAPMSCLQDVHPAFVGHLAGLGGLHVSESDIDNHLRIAEWTQRTFIPGIQSNAKARSEVAKDLEQLVHAAEQIPALALGVAMALYSYFWWEGPHSTAINVQAGREAANHLYRSIVHSNCDLNHLPLEAFWARQCHTRWRHLIMISAELGRYIAVHQHDMPSALDTLRKASGYLHQVRALSFFSRYQGHGQMLQKAHDTNFNQDLFPRVHFGPLWPVSEVPLAVFLEAHYQEFLADVRLARSQ